MAQQQENNAVAGRLNDSLKRLEAESKLMYKYIRNLCPKCKDKECDEVVTTLVRIHLGAELVYELPRPHFKIPKFIPEYVQGVKWDSVLYMESS